MELDLPQWVRSTRYDEVCIPMTVPERPYEAPHSKPTYQKATAGRVRSFAYRLAYVVGSMLSFYFGPQVLDLLVAEPQTSGGIEIASLGGLTLLIAFWSLFVGSLLLLFGSRVATLVVAAGGLASLLALPVTTGELTRYISPTLWAWFVAYVILAAGALRGSCPRAAH